MLLVEPHLSHCFIFVIFAPLREKILCAKRLIKYRKYFGYQLYVSPVRRQHSPNFCQGYLVSFDKAFLGRPANSSQIWQVANKTGWDEGGQNTTASPNPPCTVNALFCVPFTKAYEQSYAYHIPYWAGVKAGNKYADYVIDTCTQKNHPNFGFLEHHIAQYKKGFLDGYGNSVGDSEQC